MFKKHSSQLLEKTDRIQADKVIDAFNKLSGTIQCNLQIASSYSQYISTPTTIELGWDNNLQMWSNLSEISIPIDRTMTLDFGILKHRTQSKAFDLTRECNGAAGDVLIFPRGTILWDF